MKASLRKNSKEGQTILVGDFPIAKYILVRHDADIRPEYYFVVYSYIKDEYIFETKNEYECFDVLKEELNEFCNKLNILA